MPSKEAVEIFGRNMELVSAGKIREWVDLFTEDAVLEFPFPPPGFPPHIKGKEALYEHMKNFPQLLEVTFSTPVYYDAADPGLVIADFTSEGRALMTGNRFHQTYLSLVWTANGKITRYRDFWDPWVIIQALGGPEALAGPVENH
ncbi:nuclear transport factor 2 family protein [Streptosporangium oxazolinicum]|uniref:Nuclear transport factor 2 family protein n=1 Tax=Streptosporangium oxazolinicum TaxID=909287 RepID=A0ABP8ALG6_9ACTN